MQAPAVFGANYNFILPTTAGTNNYVLATDGAGNTSWIASVLGNLTSSSAFSGDMSGTQSTTSVDKIKGVAVSIAALAAHQVLQYNGTNIVNKQIPTCSGTEYLTFDGSNYACVTDAGSGTPFWIAATGGIETTLGNVGIGTSGTPEATLDVNGSLTTKASTEGMSNYDNSGNSYTIPDTSVNIRRILLDDNAILRLPAFTAPSGKVFTLTVFVQQDGTGSRTMTWVGDSGNGDIIKWDNNAQPSISTTPGAITILQFTKPSDEAVWYASKVWQEN